MAVTPTLGPYSLDEGAWLLQGLYLVDAHQLREGVPGIMGALVPGSAGPGRRRLRYLRRDKREHWRNLKEIWQYGGGDCEDLAAAVAAELTVIHGIPAQPVVYRVRPGLAHVVVETADGRMLDPSKIGGMGETPSGGRSFRPDLAHLQRRRAHLLAQLAPVPRSWVRVAA